MQADRRGQSRAGAQARPTVTDHDPLLGRTLDGRYRITSRIARGGMAGVYEATDLRLDRTVAVKVMHSGMGGGGGGLGDDSAYVARFVREARAAARLSHPHVVSVYDQGEDGGSPYLVMELVPGHTLRDTITSQSPMAPRRALALLEPVLAALAAAHRAGLVHRDIKPENVLISDEGAIKVADFGLARAVTADTQHTSTGVLIGTVSYIAPEIVTEGRADARADVYSAGILLYELLTGRKPHEGETPIQVAYKHVHEDVAPPSRLVPALPPYVDALVARATARDPGLRPADAGVLLRQVQRVGSALAAGMRDDEELTADLALPARVTDDTTPERWDQPLDLHDDRTRAVSRPTRAPAPLRAPVAAPVAAPASARRRRGPLKVALAVLLVAAIAGAALWFGYLRYTSTPGVLGLTQAAAQSRLKAAGLDVEVGRPAYSDTVAAGRVLRTSPSPGDRVLDGGTVTVVLSKGVEQYQVPDLAGRTVDQAQDALLGIKMTYGKAVKRWSETVPAGQVIRTDPAAGATLRPGTSVDVWVSKGRRPIEVADWTGKSLDRARPALEGAGLTVETDSRYDDDVPEGRVISQSPDSGTLYKGDTVSLVVSRGPQLVEIPGGLRGMGVDAATGRLEDLGFKVETAKTDHYLGLGFVWSSDPDSGKKIPKGSTITLYLV
ncbi:serine/threonine protein kinase [Nocardioides terrae]|uniref:non-specific serine/threonine protein kinase n=2 Tax=Nocardioides terrae TaxID=574651 RepID=A0A1I1G0M5_9ACTN|nr:Stk1 family PASTA domain-containing Ser/Thr kinase [Nocardioides terrae]SFC05379.1 serine/threonine protein kinase [Nocardioides terrae]